MMSLYGTVLLTYDFVEKISVMVDCNNDLQWWNGTL